MDYDQIKQEFEKDLDEIIAGKLQRGEPVSLLEVVTELETRHGRPLGVLKRSFIGFVIDDVHRSVRRRLAIERMSR